MTLIEFWILIGRSWNDKFHRKTRKPGHSRIGKQSIRFLLYSKTSLLFALFILVKLNTYRCKFSKSVYHIILGTYFQDQRKFAWSTAQFYRKCYSTRITRSTRGVTEPSIKSDVTHSTKQFFTSLEATCDRIAKLFFMSFRAITIKTLLWFHVKLKATLRTLCMKHSGNQYVQRQIWFCGILANKQDQGFWQKENNCLVLTSPQRFSFLAKYDKFSWQINFKCHPLRNQLWTIR